MGHDRGPTIAIAFEPSSLCGVLRVIGDGPASLKLVGSVRSAVLE
jgi:hypothetical protein